MSDADAPAQSGPAAPTAEHSPTLSDRLVLLAADGDLPPAVRATAEAALIELGSLRAVARAVRRVRTAHQGNEQRRALVDLYATADELGERV